ncbi:MAG: TIR domain-containing protein [Chloroflexota bacterium]
MRRLTVFISYSRQEKDTAAQLAEIIQDGGHRAWFDHHLMPGQRWKPTLEKAILDCDAFLLALSRNALQSEWCIWEYTQAVAHGKAIFPVMIESFEPIYPEELEDLANIQYLDMSGGITPKNSAALIGGLHIARPIDVGRGGGIANIDALPTESVPEDSLSHLALNDSNIEGTEPLTRLPLPNENPLPKGVSATLTVVESPDLDEPETVPILTTMTQIGRLSKMEVTIKQKRISKHHATIYWANGAFFLVDYSLNGTWLNGERLVNNRPVKLSADFNHRINLARKNTVLNFIYTAPE